MTKETTNKAIIYDEFFIDILCARKLKEIVSEKAHSGFIGQEILICDKEKAYGIIILNQPHILDVDLFKNHESRHFITEIGMEENWPGVRSFSAFSFRIKKIFKEPLQFVYMGEERLAMGKFVEGVTLMKENLDYSDVAKAIAIVEYEDKLQALKNIEVNDEDKELQKLFLELYELFLKRFSEKARHDPEEDARRRRERARRNRKKKPKKKAEKALITTLYRGINNA